MKNTRTHIRHWWTSCLAAGGLAALCLTATLCLAGNAPLPATASVFGTSQTEWQELYWRWYYGGLTLPVDANGNAHVGSMVLMPIPPTPGDGTPGHQDVTLKTAQFWVLPFWALIGTSYTDGTPPDPLVGPEIFKTLDISFQVDGQTVVSSQNVMEYFFSTPFDPPVVFNSPPIAALIWMEDIGVVHNPMSVGTHILKLDVKNTIPLPPNFGGGVVEYHNTWTITVQP
jgi:hypothetical protein